MIPLEMKHNSLEEPRGEQWSPGGQISLLETRTRFEIGANPTIVIYNASVVNFYNATGRLERFEKKLFYFVKRSSLLQRWRCSCKLKKS
jgi:hypothetical protein